MFKFNEVAATKVNAIAIMEDESMYVIMHLDFFGHYLMKQAKDCTLSDVLSSDNKVVQIVKVES